MTDFCIKRVLKKIRGIPLRVFCVMLVLAQCALLDYYLVTHISLLWSLWAIADILVTSVFILAFIVSYKHLSWPSRNVITAGGELPLGYIAWGVYSFFLCIKIGILFSPDMEIGPTLTDDSFFGTNTLKAAVSISAVVYLLLVLSHHDAAPGSDRALYIKSISNGVAFDILDTIQFLDMLFIQKIGILLTMSMHKTILGVACINLLLPTIQLLVLSRTQFAKGLYPKKLRLVHNVLYLTAINLPMLVIRVILWNVHQTNVSVFLIKNTISIGSMLYTCYEFWMEIDKLEKREDEAVEMREVPCSPSKADESSMAADATGGDDSQKI